MIRRNPTSSLRTRLASQSFRNRMSANTPDAEFQNFFNACDDYKELLFRETNKFFNQNYDLNRLGQALVAKYGDEWEGVDMGEAIIANFEDTIFVMILNMKNDVKTGKLDY